MHWILGYPYTKVSVYFCVFESLQGLYPTWESSIKTSQNIFRVHSSILDYNLTGVGGMFGCRGICDMFKGSDAAQKLNKFDTPDVSVNQRNP